MQQEQVQGQANGQLDQQADMLTDTPNDTEHPNIDANDDDNQDMHREEPATQDHQSIKVNGGIDDDDPLEMMSRDVNTMHAITAEDQSPNGPNGSSAEQC